MTWTCELCGDEAISVTVCIAFCDCPPHPQIVPCTWLDLSLEHQHRPQVATLPPFTPVRGLLCDGCIPQALEFVCIHDIMSVPIDEDGRLGRSEDLNWEAL